MSDWQPIESAPLNTLIDLWAATPEGDGWRKTGELVDDDPQCLIDEDTGRAYFPHENGAWFSHWMPFPAPPEAQEV